MNATVAAGAQRIERQPGQFAPAAVFGQHQFAGRRAPALAQQRARQHGGALHQSHLTMPFSLKYFSAPGWIGAVPTASAVFRLMFLPCTCTWPMIAMFSYSALVTS